MFELSAIGVSRRVVALVFCSAAIAVSAPPASARPHHGAGRRNYQHHVAGYSGKHFHRARSRRLARVEDRASQPEARGFFDAPASVVPRATAGDVFATANFVGSSLIAEARRHLGGNPTDRRSLWCARFMNLVLEHTGHRGTGSDMASSFAHYGQRIAGPQVGAIAVMGRRGGGHVGIVTGVDAKGNLTVISGNSSNRVREVPVSRGRIYAYVMPN